MLHKGYFNKLFNNPVASPKFYLKLIITHKYNHMREEKSKQTEGEKNHAKQYHHKI